jgi:hypothetical protein
LNGKVVATVETAKGLRAALNVAITAREFGEAEVRGKGRFWRPTAAAGSPDKTITSMAAWGSEPFFSFRSGSDQTARPRFSKTDLERNARMAKLHGKIAWRGCWDHQRRPNQGDRAAP